MFCLLSFYRELLKCKTGVTAARQAQMICRLMSVYVIGPIYLHDTQTPLEVLHHSLYQTSTGYNWYFWS